MSDRRQLVDDDLEPTVASTDPATRSTEPPIDRLRSVTVRFGALLLALPPALWMATYVLRGGTMPFFDYWIMAERVFEPNGGIDVSAVLRLQNEHPVVFPDLLYWANARFTGGSNVTLGLVMVGVIFAQVALISRFVEQKDRNSITGLVLVATASILLFSRQGAHQFFWAYGSPTANLLAIGAVFARSRGRTTLAVLLGVAASMSNAQGLMVWPALIVTGMVKDRRWRPDLVVLGYGALTTLGYLVLRENSGAPGPGPVAALRSSAAVIGSAVANSVGATQAVAALGLLVAGLLVWVAVRRGLGSSAPWIGVMTYAVAAAALIGQARAGLVASTGVESRYTPLSALFLVSTLGLAATVFGFRRVMAAPMVLAAVFSLRLGGEEIDNFFDRQPQQEEFAAALRLDLGDGFSYLPYIGYPRVAPVLEGFGHYPFDGRWDGDCGYEGERLPPSPLAAPEDGNLERAVLMDHQRGTRLFGWVPADLVDEVDCILVTDERGDVVGFGAVGVPGTIADVDAARKFAAVAPVGPQSYTTAAVLDDGTVIRLSGVAPAPTADDG